MGERFLLELPTVAAAVSTVRLFAASLARHHRLPEERVEDVKLGISEACSAVLAGSEDADGRLRVTVERDRDRLRFEVRRKGGEGEGGAPLLGVEILRSLFPDARVVEGEAVSFSAGFGSAPNG